MTGCTSINTLIFVGTASCCSLEGSEQRGVDMRAHLVVQRVHGRGGARGLERGGPHASILRRIGRFSACSMLLHRRCARRRRTVVAGTLRPLLSTRIFDAWPPIALSHTRGIDKSTMRAEQGDRIAALAQHIREWIDRRFALQREHVRGRDGRRQQAPARLEGAYGRGGRIERRADLAVRRQTRLDPLLQRRPRWGVLRLCSKQRAARKPGRPAAARSK